MQDNPTFAKRKVLAGVVLSKGYKRDSCKLISVSTGTKCVNGEYLSTSGTVINDSHAEIICRYLLPVLLDGNICQAITLIPNSLQCAGTNRHKIYITVVLSFMYPLL